VVHIKDVKDPARHQFYALLSANLLANTDPEIANRLVEGSEVIIQSADGSRQISSENWFNILLPVIAGLAFIIAMFSAGGYLMQAVVDEKENRTMEVIITSVSPNQFMAGKIIGDTAVGLTQILSWIGFIVLLVLFGRNKLEFLQGIQFSSQTVVLIIVVMLPAFVMVAALMAAIGATVTEAREGQQMIGILSLPIWIPYILMGVLIGNPNSPVAVGLSLFPLTAPLTMLIRDGMTIIPAGQIAACTVILVLSAAGAIWLAGRAFRLGMLSYGKRIAWREVFARQGAKS
jgi:ABC-2 type transport system permease protein